SGILDKSRSSCLWSPPGQQELRDPLQCPPSAEFVSRVSGISTMYKLPHQESAEGLDAAFIGVPIDTGTSNRPGARFGPRQIRVESALLRSFNSGTRAAPYDSLMVADIGDVKREPVRPEGHVHAHQRVSTGGSCLQGASPSPWVETTPLHTPSCSGTARGSGHVDAHADTSDVVLGERIGHGTPFRRCVEEGLLDCSRVVQIGLRGSGYSADSYAWSRAQVPEINKI
ncbi:hypothetical protein KUCAC02_034779, partial [Chaenocephalus aceratus]